MLRKKEIRGRLFFWLLLFTLIPLFIIASLNYDQLRQDYLLGARNTLTLDAIQNKAALEALLASYKQRLNTFGVNQILQTLLEEFNDTEHEEGGLGRLKEKADHFQAVELEEFFQTAHFIGLRVVGVNGKVFIDTQGRENGQDLSSDIAFQEGLKEVFVEYRFDSQGDSVLIVTGPVFPHAIDRGASIGVLSLTAAIDETKRHVKAAENTKHAYLIDQQGRVIAKSIPEGGKALPSRVLEQAKQGGEGIFENSDVIISVQNIEEIGGALLISADLEAFFGPIRLMRNQLLLVMITLSAVGIFFSLRVSRWIAMPIQSFKTHLNTTLAELKKGNPGKQLTLQTGDELEDLSDRFNDLIELLRQKDLGGDAEKKKFEEALGRSYKELADIKYALDHAAIVAITDQKGIIQYVNDKFCEISKYSKEEVIGQSHRIISSGYHAKEFIRNQWQTVANGKIWRGEYKNRAKDGSYYWVDTTIVPFLNSQGKPYQYLAIRTDITRRKRGEERLSYMAHHDALTGLPNRTLFYDRLNQAIAQAHPHKRLVALLYLDLDRFKIANDALGHAFGDKLLKAVAERLTLCLFEGDTVTRVGGDEFILLLPTVAREENVTLVAEKVLEGLRPPFRIEEHEMFITGSIGISLYPRHGEEAEILVINADTAMYRAKEDRDGYEIYSPDTASAKTSRHLEMETNLRHALERNEFSLRYQPEIDLRDGKLIGGEALIRWKQPGVGIISPSEFIPILEETGMIIPVGEWILRTACAKQKAWQEAGFWPGRIWVNISARQFRHGNFIEMLTRVLEETGLEPAAIGLELTEGILMKKTEEAVSTLQKIKNMGIHLAIDDFGTGYSSLSYLKRFPIDVLKIDKSFVDHIGESLQTESIIDTVIALAHNLKLKVVAEGIETQKQLDFLRNRQCEEGQGYLFSRPLTAEAFTELMSEDRCFILTERVSYGNAMG